jgi:hypothetical protein
MFGFTPPTASQHPSIHPHPSFLHSVIPSASAFRPVRSLLSSLTSTILITVHLSHPFIPFHPSFSCVHCTYHSPELCHSHLHSSIRERQRSNILGTRHAIASVCSDRLAYALLTSPFHPIPSNHSLRCISLLIYLFVCAESIQCREPCRRWFACVVWISDYDLYFI